MEAIEAALNTPERDWPELPVKAPSLPNGKESVVALLQALLRLRCEDNGVAMRLVATRSDLDSIAMHDEPAVPALRGWRRKVFGEDALALRDGRLALTGCDGDVAVVSLEVGGLADETDEAST